MSLGNVNYQFKFKITRAQIFLKLLIFLTKMRNLRKITKLILKSQTSWNFWFFMENIKNLWSFMMKFNFYYCLWSCNLAPRAERYSGLSNRLLTQRCWVRLLCKRLWGLWSDKTNFAEEVNLSIEIPKNGLSYYCRLLCEHLICIFI
jgi:hypothetical protein